MDLGLEVNTQELVVPRGYYVWCSLLLFLLVLRTMKRIVERTVKYLCIIFAFYVYMYTFTCIMCYITVAEMMPKFPQH